jgi:transposase-like protein
MRITYTQKFIDLILELRFGTGQSYDSLATDWGVNVKTVKKWVKEAEARGLADEYRERYARKYASTAQATALEELTLERERLLGRVSELEKELAGEQEKVARLETLPAVIEAALRMHTSYA